MTSTERCLVYKLQVRNFDNPQTISLQTDILSGERKIHHSVCLQAEQDAELNKQVIENKSISETWIIQVYIYNISFSFQYSTFQSRISSGWIKHLNIWNHYSNKPKDLIKLNLDPSIRSDKEHRDKLNLTL